MKKRYKVNFNVPFLVLLFFLVVMIAEIILILGHWSGFLFLKVIGYSIMFIGFLLCLYIMIGCCYYFFKILAGKCCLCGKELENRNKKAITFLLTPPWKKRKVKFLCRDCQKSRGI